MPGASGGNGSAFATGLWVGGPPMAFPTDLDPNNLLLTSVYQGPGHSGDGTDAGPGSDGGWMHPDLLTKAGVALIFFLHGLALPFAALRAGVMQWKLHLVVQLCTYLLFPILGLILLRLLPPLIQLISKLSG